MFYGNITRILHPFPYPCAASFGTWSETPPTIWDPLLFIWQSKVGLLYFDGKLQPDFQLLMKFNLVTNI